jgi:cation diffusion facilitator CzcD-associated flavoprotein CzcO
VRDNADEPSEVILNYDVIVVGAGFSGLYMLYRLQQMGRSVRLYEAGSKVGGVWYWNRYPGAQCDTFGVDYSFSFSSELQQEWSWSAKLPPQQEMQRYFEHVADRFDLKRDIQFDTRVVSASLDEASESWTVRTDRGDVATAPFVVMAAGVLSKPKLPQIKGLESFEGARYHTANWPDHPVDFSGQRVAVIGNGSSGVQSIPVIAEQAAHLYAVQRTPAWSLPANNQAWGPEELEEFKKTYDEHRQRAWRSFMGIDIGTPTKSALEVDAEERDRTYETRWEGIRGGAKGSTIGAMMMSYTDLLTDREANETVCDFVRAKIRSIVRDPKVAESLCPDTPFGIKRPCVGAGYYETFNRDNVTLIDLRRQPITRITESGFKTSEGFHELDAIVFATGFDSMTGPLLAIDLKGRGGQDLRAKWADGPSTYVGLTTSGFPNMFLMTGSQSPSVLSNLPLSAEQQGDWIAECLDYLRDHEITLIEATTEAERAWVEHNNSLAEGTLYPTTKSWYMGDDVPGKPRMMYPYLGGVPQYGAKLQAIAAAGYEGLSLTKRKASSVA